MDTNASKASPGVEIELFGEKKFLSATFRTLVSFEKKTGKNAMLRNNWTIEDLCVLVWAALGGENSGKTVDQVVDELGGRNLPEVTKLIGTLFGQAELTEAQKNDVAA